MKRFQELLMKDIGWKLLSVAIAAIMWFMVINITQPVDTRSYSRSIALENIETLTNRGLTIGNEEELKNTKITIKIKAQRTALDRLSQNPEWLQASVDFSGLTEVVSGDVITLPIDIHMQNGLTDYDIVNRSPAAIEAHIETLISRRIPVQITVNGEVAADVYLSDPTLSTESVIVTGPYSIMNRVSKVIGMVNAMDIRETPELRVKLAAYDAAGAPVKGVSLSLQDVLVSYAIHDWKQVPIQIEVTGTPAPGYQVGEVSCSPQYAEIAGTPEALKDILYLQLESIDVSELNTPIAQSFSLTDYLPEGISLKRESTTAATVLVDIIEQNGRSFTLDETNLTLLGQEEGLLYYFDSTEIIVSGDADALAKMTAEQLNASVYVNGLTEGEHTVLVHTELPEGLTAVPASLNLTVSSPDNAETEIPEDETESTETE